MVKVKFDSQTKQWLVLPKGFPEGIYLDGFIFKSFVDAKKVMKKKEIDLVIAITGYPGTGKSTFVSQVASFCDPNFNYKRMYQTAEEFIEGVKNSKVGEAHVLDESYKDLNSNEIRRETGRAILNVLNIIRQKRLYIFIVLPSFFDLHKSIAVFRTRWLFHCYSHSFGDIGYFVAFDRDSKRKLYIKGKKFEEYNVVKGDHYGKFTKKVPDGFDWEEYEKVKEKNLQRVFVFTQEDRSSVVQRNKLIYYLYATYNYTTKKLSELSGLSLSRTKEIILKSKRDIARKKKIEEEN